VTLLLASTRAVLSSPATRPFSRTSPQRGLLCECRSGWRPLSALATSPGLPTRPHRNVQSCSRSRLATLSSRPSRRLPRPAIALAASANAVTFGCTVQLTTAPAGGVTLRPERSVTLALAQNPTGGSLTGALTVLTDINGLATFSALTITRAGNPYQLIATSPDSRTRSARRSP